MRRLVTCSLVTLLAVGPWTLGCSLISTSLESSSTIISSPFKSLGSSSGSSSPEAAYQQDVVDFTAAHVQSGGDAAALRKEISRIAKDNGITDWEKNEATYVGVGKGLAKAGYRQVQVDAFKKNFATTPDQAEWLQSGFDSGAD